MKRCPFAENEYCVENNCSLWYDGCLVRQALIRYIKDGNEIEKLICQSTDCILDAVCNGVHYG